MYLPDVVPTPTAAPTQDPYHATAAPNIPSMRSAWHLMVALSTSGLWLKRSTGGFHDRLLFCFPYEWLRWFQDPDPTWSGVI